MRAFADFPFIAPSRFGMLAALLAVLFLFAGEASAVDLSVSPKNEKTLYKPEGGTASPKALKYILKATDGKKVRWTLKSYPKWLVPEATSGKAKKKKAKLRFAANTAVIDALAPGFYKKSISFVYGKKKKKTKVRRNVTLIVEGNATDGRDLFQAKCSGCHDLYQNKSGPYIFDVYGRKAGTANGFDHSDALRKYGKVWEEENLNDWLADTQKLVKNADMYFRLKDPAERMNIIAYLKGISP